MSGYLLGLATIPVAVIAVAVTYMLIRLAYIGLGKVGRVGIIRFGKTNEERRLTLGAAIATCGHLLVVLNRGNTGLILFTGSQDPDDPFGAVSKMKSRMYVRRSLDECRNAAD